MTTIVNNYLTNPFNKIAQNIIGAYKSRKMIRTTTIELGKLTDRELNDLGISRGDIYSIAHGDKTRSSHHQINYNSDGNINLKGWV